MVFAGGEGRAVKSFISWLIGDSRSRLVIPGAYATEPGQRAGDERASRAGGMLTTGGR